MEKILRINMTAKSCRYEALPEQFRGLGGRGLTSSVVAHEVPPRCDPLGPENKLVIAPGTLSGTACPNSGRMSVGGKSPLTGGIKESNVGGNSSAKIARLGLAAIIIEGRPEPATQHVLTLTQGSAELVPAQELKGQGTYDLANRLYEKYGRKTAIVCIGPAGEMQLASASIQVTNLDGKPCRAAGRGGMGSVMGSKGLKAIIVDDTDGISPALKNPELFKSGQKKVADAILAHPMTAEAMPAQGTAMVVAPINMVGAFPAINATVGTYEKWEQISGDALARLISERGGKTTHSGCSNCIIRCSNVFVDKDKNYVTSGLEYETIWAIGGMCDLADFDAIARFDYFCDDLGVDTMNTGCAVAVAMEAGLKQFGDAVGALGLVEEIGKRSEIGRLIGEGPAAVGKKYGIARVPVVKNQSIAAYDPRAIQGMGVTYATCPMGADHTAGWTVAASLEALGGKLDPLAPEGQVACSREVQIQTAAADCTGICQFAGFPLADIPSGGEGLFEMINGKYGTTIGPQDVTELGKRVLRVEHEFNLKAGLTSKDNRLPDFFYKEALPPHNKTFLVKDEELDKLFDF